MSELDGRILFIVTLVIDEPSLDGQKPRAINIPAFVADWQTAADRANAYLANFSITPEGKQLAQAELAAGRSKELKMKLQSIMVGGTILT
jgi:hypothetical protein